VYQDIIWDLDGTLFNTYPAMVAALGRVLSDHGIVPDLTWLMSLAKQSIGHCVATLASTHQLPEAVIERAFESHYARIDSSAQPPFPGVREICSYISRLGGRNFIVTHRDKGSTLGLLRAHQFGQLFSGWITNDDGYPRKPDPAAFKAALERYDLDPRTTMAVGDRDIDTVAAHAAGLFTCQLGVQSSAVKPDLQIAEFAQLADFLRCPTERPSRSASGTAPK
jgi:phosphoglycolate phosphatase-like HAD superfamily hydrolase